MNVYKGRRVYSAEEMAQALRESRGLLSLAARKLGCSRITVYNHVNRHPSVKEALDDAREEMKDRAECKLYDAIENSEAWGICFYLKTQAKDRGYVEREHADDDTKTPLVVMVNGGHGNPT